MEIKREIKDTRILHTMRGNRYKQECMHLLLAYNMAGDMGHPHTYKVYPGDKQKQRILRKRRRKRDAPKN